MVTSGLPERLLSTTDPVVTSLSCKREKVLRLTPKCLATAAAVIYRSIPTASCLSCKFNIRHLALKKWTLNKANHAASCNTSSDEMRKRQALSPINSLIHDTHNQALLVSISSVIRSCDAVSDQKSLKTQKHARDARCCVVRDAIIPTALSLTCSFNELMPLFIEFCDFLFSNFKFQIHAFW